MVSKRILLSAVCLTAFLCTAQATDITIRNQKDFDDLGVTIKNAIGAGANDVTVHFTDGVYYYGSNHIVLKEIVNPGLSLHFTGDKVSVIGKGAKVDKFGKYEYLYMREQEHVDSWTLFYQAQDTVEIADMTTHLCRIKHDEGIGDARNPRGKYIQVTLWFKSSLFPIEKIEGNYIYFNAGELAKAREGLSHSINMDYAYAKTYPRYRLFGFKTIQNVYECRASCFLDMEDCKIKSLDISGISFNGCSRDNHLILLKNVKAERVKMADCSFSNIGGAVVYLTNTDNVIFERNTVRNTYGAALVSDNQSSGTKAIKNSFENLDLKMSNSHGLLIQGADFLIEGNTFENFSYSAIGVGNHYTKKGLKPCYGKILDNEIFLSGDYLQHPEQHTLMDGGAIYVWTQTDGIEIYNNYIHDIVGMKDNRGIFCDDGAKNVTIKGNIIERIHNGACISLRECAYVAPYVPDYNSGNTIEGNYVDGNVRFFKKDNTCKYDGSSTTTSIGFYFSRAYWFWRKKR